MICKQYQQPEYLLYRQVASGGKERMLRAGDTVGGANCRKAREAKPLECSQCERAGAGHRQHVSPTTVQGAPFTLPSVLIKCQSSKIRFLVLV